MILLIPLFCHAKGLEDDDDSKKIFLRKDDWFDLIWLYLRD